MGWEGKVTQLNSEKLLYIVFLSEKKCIYCKNKKSVRREAAELQCGVWHVRCGGTGHGDQRQNKGEMSPALGATVD